MTLVLIIEDEIHIRQNLVDILSYAGFDTLQAEDGFIGIELAQQRTPDIILCDIMMPDMDGYTVLRRLQSIPSTSTIPFIFLSAITDRPSIRYGMELGADDYVTKPFTANELLAAVQIRLTKHAVNMRQYQKPGTNSVSSSSPLTISPDAQSLIGVVVNGYQIREKIGEGGIGTVYKAYQIAIGREVAIKVLRPTYARNTEFLLRFQTEAELIARLEHPHIIPLYDYWYDGNGVYIAMRLLRGGSLRAALQQRGALALPTVARILTQIADALAVAHNAGIIHRDVKPDNILMDQRGNSYLTDFGLAKNLLAGTRTSSTVDLNTLLEAQETLFQEQPTTTLFITDAEHLAGTPAYLSPEQIHFESLSPQSDIYSLGITIYEMLTGQPPFSGTLGEIVQKHLNERIPDASEQHSDIPDAIDSVIQKATAKDWKHRYTNVLAFADDFQKACKYV